VGAEQINPVPLQQFAEALEPCGFDQKAFVACYGMAECVLAVSFAPLDLGLSVDHVDQDIMTNSGKAVPAEPGSGNIASYADCGLLLPGFEFSIRDDSNNELPERECHERIFPGCRVDQDSTK
jgi:fatty-acyl-CoA synthase